VGGRQAARTREPWTIARAAEVAGIDASALEQVARLYAESAPALIRLRLGPGAESQRRQRGDGVLSLPAVGGKFGGPRRRLLDEQLGVVEDRALVD